jgi:hypothetical protein
MLNSHTDPDRLDQLWTTMQGEKGDIERRSEEYARWTIPSVCPEDGTEGVEQEKADVAIGPRLVNHLANKIVDTMFPHDRPFFAVTLTPEMRKQLRDELGADQAAQFAELVRTETANVEEAAMRKLKLGQYRPQAVEAVKHQIVTGNAVLRRMPDGTRVVYGIKDFCIRRDINGKPMQVLLVDAKKFGSLPEDIKRRVLNVHREYADDTDCKLYTYYKWDGNRWRMLQAVDDVMIDKGVRYKPVDCPFIALTWNLSRGENYGRGLVEDHTTAFHQIDVLTKAMIDMVGVMADIKFLVDPASVLDPEELNASPRGSYHQGRRDDISTPESSRRLEIQSTLAIIQGLERELAQAFLLNSSAVRDAERVTAEEIRFIAMELESAFGGLYSRLALEWQRKEAEYAVSQINFNADLSDSKLASFEVVVVTGLESLSREGQLDNLRRALADLQMLETVPEDVRATMNPMKFANFIFTNHAVKWEEFQYTQEEMEANNQAAMQNQQNMLGMEAQANVAEEAGKQAVKQER